MHKAHFNDKVRVMNTYTSLFCDSLKAIYTQKIRGRVKILPTLVTYVEILKMGNVWPFINGFIPIRWIPNLVVTRSSGKPINHQLLDKLCLISPFSHTCPTLVKFVTQLFTMFVNKNIEGLYSPQDVMHALLMRTNQDIFRWDV